MKNTQNMRKLLSLPTIITATSIIILIGAVVYLSDWVNDLGTDLEITQEKLEQSEAEVKELTKEIEVLQDSLTTLNLRIEDLESTAKEREILIKELSGKIKRRNKLIDELKAEITSLYQKGNHDTEQIKALQAELETIGGQLMDFQEKQEELKNKQKVLEAEKQKVQQKTDDNTRLHDIMLNTSVQYNKVVLTKKNRETKISTLKKKDKSWRYTKIEFAINHPNPEYLIGKEFRLKIKDLDNEKTLPVNEDNPKHPDSQVGKAGEKFIYDGNPIEINYFNSQHKTGKNYEIQIFYLENGKAYQLKNGKRPIVSEGKVLPH